MRIDPDEKRYVTWPVSGIPSAAPNFSVRFDGGDPVEAEYVEVEGVRVGVRVLVCGPDSADQIGAVPLPLGPHTVRLSIDDYPEYENLDGGVLQVAAAPADTVPTFGATWQAVTDLAPHISVSELPALDGDKIFKGSSQKVTTEAVQQWIRDVASVVDVTLIARSALSEGTRTALESAARTVVVNGAAAYLVSAAFPAKAGVNDNTSYSAELEQRYQTGLLALKGMLDGWLETGGGDIIETPPGGKIAGRFPPSLFPDPYVVGRAPGAEYPWV